MKAVGIALALFYALAILLVVLKARKANTCPFCYYPRHRCECESPPKESAGLP